VNAVVVVVMVAVVIVAMVVGSNTTEHICGKHDGGEQHEASSNSRVPIDTIRSLPIVGTYFCSKMYLQPKRN
jgi:hypothetical protein